MNTVRILIYHGKHGDQYWLADTPTREMQALQALFTILDEWGCYTEVDNTDVAHALPAAREGDPKAIHFILSVRDRYEYEEWVFEDVEVPCNGGLPGKTELLGFDAYQVSAHGTAVYPQHAGILYAALGLAGEGGEIAGKLIALVEAALHVSKHTGEVANQAKKVLRDDNNVLTEARKQAIVKELGGMFWYAAEIATILGINLSAVPHANLTELYSRKDRGTLKGDGDNR